MSKAEDAIRHNMADVMENGPGIRYGRRTANAARCPTGKHALRTGLGAMGVGSMWAPATDQDREDEEWESLPVQQCSSFGIGEDEVCPTDS